jgi:hypothetical protein
MGVFLLAVVLLGGCLSNHCEVYPEHCIALDDAAVESDDSASASTTEATEHDTEGSSDSGTMTDPATSSDEGAKVDMLAEESTTGGPCLEMGCAKIDMLFVLDGSTTMLEELDALKDQHAFAAIVGALETLNCGTVDYRIGVTGDNDDGWITPINWPFPDPWFASSEFTAEETAAHFEAAVTLVGNGGGAPLGCEHVLTSAVNLLGNDTSEFVREDALLVLVLLTDVDDYGAYDQPGGNSCGFGCPDGGPAVQAHYDTLVALKTDDPSNLAAIVLAGDPTSTAGVNICNQPQSCQAAYHATRLYEFASLLGENGVTADICDGALSQAIEAALANNIEIACQEFG